MTEIRESPHELLALAVAMREDWDRDDTWGALRAAHDAGWGWKRTADEVWRLLWLPDGDPASLRAACRKPVLAPPTGPEVNARGKALAMAAWQNPDVLDVPRDDETGEPAA